jgi:hypothetical protein
MSEQYRNYLRDLGGLIAESALKAKQEMGSTNDGYSIGFLMAYYEVVSLMQSQALLFEIPLAALGLAHIEPDRDLL